MPSIMDIQIYLIQFSLPSSFISWVRKYVDKNLLVQRWQFLSSLMVLHDSSSLWLSSHISMSTLKRLFPASLRIASPMEIGCFSHIPLVKLIGSIFDFLLAGCYTIETYFPAVLEARSPKMRCQQSHAFSETLARILSWIFLASGSLYQALAILDL